MANAGTMTLVNDGGGTVPMVVCFGSPVQLIHNGDYVLPPSAPGNQAGVMLAIFSCPPTEEDIELDPCFTNFYWTGESFDGINSGDIQTVVGLNHFWFAPVASDATIAPINHDADGDDCFDINLMEAYEFTFLNEIMISLINQDNCAGEVTIQITGGYPELFPGSYLVTNAGAGTLTQSGASGEIITISNLNNGDSYAISMIDDGNGCSANFSGGPITTTTSDPSFTFPDFCEGASNGPSSITTPGGTFALSPPPGDGAGINTISGEISGGVANNTYSVIYTTPGPCPTTSAPVLVTVLPAPPPPMVGSFFQICPGESFAIIPTGTGGIFNFYDNPGLGIPIASGVPFDPSGIVTPGIVTTFYVTETNAGGCESPPTPFNVLVLNLGQPIVIPSAVTACSGTDITITPLTGNGQVPATFNFYSDAGLNTLLASGPSYTFTATTSQVIWITEEVSGCESMAVTFSVTISPPPPPPIVISQTICVNAPIPVFNAAGTGGTFNWYDIDPALGSPAPIFTGNSFTPPVNPAIPNTYTYWVTEVNVNGCEGNASIFTLTILPGPAVPLTNDPAPICINDPAPALLAFGGGGFLSWYDQNPTLGGPPIGSGSPFFPAINTSIPGTINFWVTETNAGGCEGNATMVTVTITAGPNPPIVSNPPPICANTAPPQLMAIGTGGILNWYNQDPIGGGATPIGTGSPFTPPLNTSIPGNYQFWVTEINTSGCEGAAAIVTVVVNAPLPPPNTTPTAQVCVNTPPPVLTANGQGISLNWYDQDPTTGMIIPIGNGSPFAPPLNTSIPGTTTYWVTAVDAAGCESLPNQVVVTVNDYPISSFTTDCAADLMSYTINLNTDGTQVNSNFGVVTDNEDGTFTISNIPAGQAVVLTIGNSTTMCSELFDVDAPDCNCPTVAIPVSQGNETICEGETIPMLAVTSEAGLVVNWYDALSGGNLLASNTTSYTPTAAGIYYAETVDPATDCVSNGRTPVSLTINALPTLQSSSLDCAADLLTYTVTLIFQNVDQINVNTGFITNNSGGNFTVSGIDINQSLSVNASATNTNCTADFTFNPPICGCPTVDTPINNGDLAICEGDSIPALSATVDPGFTIDWYDMASGGTLLLADSTNYTPSVGGTFYAEARDTTSNCTSTSRTAVTLTIHSLPVLIEALANCAADILSYTVELAMSNTDSIAVNTGTIINLGGGAFTVADISIDSNFIFTAFNTLTGCSSDWFISVPNCDCPNVFAPTSMGDLTICEGEAIPALSVEVDSGLVVDWYDMEVDGSLLLADSTNFTPSVAGTYFAETRNPLNDCVSTNRTAVTLTINPLPNLLTSETLCAVDLLTYTVNLTLEQTDSLIVNSGIVTNNGNGSFTVSEIALDSSLMFTALDTTNCSISQTINPPICDCPDLNAPISNGDQAICEGEALPVLSVMADPGLQVNWYDAATGGNLLVENSTTYAPTSGGIFYAEARDPVNGCVSTTRTGVTLTVNSVAMLLEVETLCSADILTYTATLTVANWDEVNFIISEGTFGTNGPGVFTISGIAIQNSLMVTAIHPDTNCGDDFVIDPPQCECPNQNAPVSAGDVAICAGVPLPSLNASAEMDQTVDWYDAPVGGNLLASASFAFSPPTAGTYYAETRHLFNGCVSTERTPITLTVNPLPSVIDTLTLCAPDLLTYTLTVSFNDADQLVASLGNVQNSGSGNFIISDIPTGSNLSLTATNSATTCSAIFNFSSPSCPCPPVELPISDGDREICEGDALVALSVATSVENTVDWYDAATGGALLQSNTLSYLPITPGIYYAETRNVINGCVQNTRVPVSLVVNDNPILVITNAIDPGCNLTNGSIELEAIQGTAPYTYAEGNGPFQDEATFVNLGPGTFDFIVVDDKGCSGATTGILNPSAGVTADAGTALPLDCSRTTTELDAGNSSGDGVITFLWTFNGTTVGETAAIAVDEPGTYVVQVSLDACTELDTVIVIDNTEEIIADIQGEGNLSCVISTVTLNAGGSTLGPEIVYEWQFEGAPIAGATDSQYEAGQAGWYSLLVRDTTNGCEAIDSLLLILDEAYPIANAGPNQQLDCDTEMVTLDGSNSQSGPQIIYSWMGPDGETIPEGTNNTVLVDMPGMYTLLVTDTINGCANESITNVIPDYTPPIADAGEEDRLDCRVTELTLDGSGSSTGTAYSYIWMSPDNGNIVNGATSLVPLINAPGNYVLTVLSSDNGCASSDTVFIEEITTFPTGFTVLTENPACIGDVDGSLVILAEDQTTPYLYALENAPFSSINQFNQLAPGNYQLSAQDDFGCTWDSIVQVLPGIDLQVDLGKDEYIRLGDSIELNALVNVPEDSIDRISWSQAASLGCIDCLHPFAQPELTTTYTITVSTADGCTNSDDITIFVDQKRHVYIPNAFSPNGDGQNDVFFIHGDTDVETVKDFIIFDRWGEIVFEEHGFSPNDPNYGWNGSFRNSGLLNSGVFVYLAKITFIDGKTEIYSGEVMLLR
ncbi:MAG: hypothetical protein DHS20C18_05000 [Saprospiraceae bacterium]|nr:MAG: hypothetical protein DHS20C18_05000 [Saprospiraceae bacterium]